MAVRVVGLAEFRAALRKIGPEWSRSLRNVYKTVADEAVNQAQGEARSMGGIQARAAGALKARADPGGAYIGVRPSSSTPMANPAFWGAKRHTGWYARTRFEHSKPQFPRWVGNSWDVAERGTGPYAINDALARYMPYLLEDFARMIDELAGKAFPER